MSKNMSKYIICKPSLIAVIITAMVLLLATAGCGDKNGQERTAPGSTVEQNLTSKQVQSAEQTPVAVQFASTVQKASAQKFPLKVTDDNGVEMTIASEPKRIISITLGSDEMLLGLVDKSRILALTKYADDAGISNVAAEAAGIKERATMDDLESVIAMKPDLVIVDTWADAKYVKQLRDAGITAYAFKTPSNIDEQKDTIADLAHITGTDEKGREILEWMDIKLKEIEEKLSGIKPKDKLTVMDYGEMNSSGKGTNFDDIVTRAGLINVVSRAGMEGWPLLSKEKIIELNPDIIILPSWYYDKNNSLQGMIDTFKNDKSMQTVKAVSNDRLISVSNPHLSAISQYVVLGIEDVAKAAYPELFK
ncbi:MAG: ABC transporter substrate-binding protein [Clostridiaceae bacterium]